MAIQTPERLERELQQRRLVVKTWNHILQTGGNKSDIMRELQLSPNQLAYLRKKIIDQAQVDHFDPARILPHFPKGRTSVTISTTAMLKDCTLGPVSRLRRKPRR